METGVSARRILAFLRLAFLCGGDWRFCMVETGVSVWRRLAFLYGGDWRFCCFCMAETGVSVVSVWRRLAFLLFLYGGDWRFCRFCMAETGVSVDVLQFYRSRVPALALKGEGKVH